MAPINYPIAFHRGESFGDTWYLRIPNLSPIGGPAALNEPGVELRAFLMAKATDPQPIAEFTVDILDPVDRTFRPRLSRSQTARCESRRAYWFVRISKGDWGRKLWEGDVDVGGV